jgi:hypothetical protein
LNVDSASGLDRLPSSCKASRTWAYNAASVEAEAKCPAAIRSSSGKYDDEFSAAAVSLSTVQYSLVLSKEERAERIGRYKSSRRYGPAGKAAIMPTFTVGVL